MRVGHAAVLVTTTVVAVACDEGVREEVPAEQGTKGESCRARNDCASDLACVRGVCVRGEFDLEPTAKSCVVIQCRDPSDCVRGSPLCLEARRRCDLGSEGACAVFRRACTFACDDNLCSLQCPGDDVCAEDETCHEGRCVQCVDDMECGNTERCVDGACRAPCQSHLQCPLFHKCEAGACVQGGCLGNRECVALTRNAEATCVEGTCRQPCEFDADCSPQGGYDFMACVDSTCRYVGCVDGVECRAAIFGAEPIPPHILDVVCEPGDGGPVDPASLPAPPPGPQLCAPEQFTCHDGQCIPAQAQCNGVEQCPDASDEIGCPEPDAGPPEEDGGRR